jgi:large subunit ribosomal protein L3
MKFTIGKKLGMTRRIEENGEIIPVTLVDVSNSQVSLLREEEKDGYEAVQVDWAVKKGSRYSCEFRVDGEKIEVKKGDKIGAEIFEKGEKVKVSGLSKGKGFQGVVKRHGFKGGPKGHGHKDNLRAPGAIGSVFPQRVIKGLRMAGRMGRDRVSKRTEIVDIMKEEGLLALKGALPGGSGNFIEISTLD